MRQDKNHSLLRAVGRMALGHWNWQETIVLQILIFEFLYKELHTLYPSDLHLSVFEDHILDFGKNCILLGSE